MNKELFENYLREVLPTLPKGSTIIMDNASSHKNLNIAALLKSTHCTILYLPPYSPQLNPIEKLWGSVKQKLKGCYRHIEEDFFQALCYAISLYSAPLVRAHLQEA